MKISNETKVGILVIFAVVLLILGFNILKGTKFLSSSKEYYAVYEDIDGLNVSDPVVVNGLKVGSVTSFTVLTKDAGKILAKFTIGKDLNIPKNTKAEIASADILGSKAIILKFGDSNEYIPSGDTLNAEVNRSITSRLMTKLGPVSDKIELTLTSLDSVLMGVNSSLDVNTQKNLRESIEALNLTMQNASRATQSLDKMIDNLDLFVKNLNDQNKKINQILTNSEEATASLAELDLNSAVEELKMTAGHLNAITEKMESGEGSLGALINDRDFYDNIEKATFNLNLLMEDLRLNPKRYVHFSVFGGKNKVRPLPSDTLK